jgi:hypothetical protein
MKIKNFDALTGDQINRELAHGARFVIFQFTISIVVMTFKRSSDIYFIKAGENATVKGLAYTFLTLIFGWWGIPWGPIYSIQSIVKNLSGGKNITSEVLASLNNAAVAKTAAA